MPSMHSPHRKSFGGNMFAWLTQESSLLKEMLAAYAASA